MYENTVKMDNYGNKKEKETTLFNISLQTLLSIRNLLDECNYYGRLCYRTDGSVNRYEALNMYKRTTDAVFNEISISLDEGEIKNYRQLCKKYRKLKDVTIIIRSPEGKRTEINPIGFQQHWSHTRKIDILLRKLANQHGMLLKGKDRDGDFMSMME